MRYVSLQDIQTPHEGFIVKLDRWWLVVQHNSKLCVVFSRLGFPQCNRIKSIVESFVEDFEKDHDEVSVRMIHLAYVPPETDV